MDFAYVLTATVERPAVYNEPDGSPIALTYSWPDGSTDEPPFVNPTSLFGPLVVQVVRGTPGDTYAEVVLPVHPTGTTGWVKTDQWEWSSTETRITVSLSDQKLRLYESGALIREADVVTGIDSGPTPLLPIGYVTLTFDGRIIGISVFADLNRGEFEGGGMPSIGIVGTELPLPSTYSDYGVLYTDRATVRELLDFIPAGTIAQIVP